MGARVERINMHKALFKIYITGLILMSLSCQGHRAFQGDEDAKSHWYTSIDGAFTVQTPASLVYRQDTLTIQNENKTFTMDLGVHHGQLKPWFFEIVHTIKPAFWNNLSQDEKGWWLKSMVQNRYPPFKVSEAREDRLLGEQQGRQMEIRAVTSATHLYLIVAAVPPGSLALPAVQNFFQSFQFNR
jgi:hypothetical protein